MSKSYDRLQNFSDKNFIKERLEKEIGRIFLRLKDYKDKSETNFLTVTLMKVINKKFIGIC